MTEDTSPENLRKFLESDDPAMVQMGLSMAKGSGVPEELLPTILRLYMWDDDKNIRASAKSVFNKHASKELKEKVKESWKPNYRTLPMGGDKFPKVISSLVERFGPQDDFVLYPVIKELENFDWYKGEIKANVAATLLGQIGDKRAIRPLIKALKTYPLDFGVEIGHTGSAPIIDALKIIGGDKAVEALIKALYKREQRADAARALGKMGDVSAVKPLIQTLKKSDNSYDRGEIIEALGNLKSKEASEILIKYLSSQNEYQQELVAIALGKIGDKRAVEPLIKALGELHKRDNRIYDDDDFRDAAIDALKKLGHKVDE